MEEMLSLFKEMNRISQVHNINNGETVALFVNSLGTFCIPSKNVCRNKGKYSRSCKRVISLTLYVRHYTILLVVVFYCFFYALFKQWSQGYLDDFTLYYIHFEITGDPCNLIGPQQCDLFTNRTILGSKSHLFLQPMRTNTKRKQPMKLNHAELSYA